jgi:hypothetical protein
MTPSAAKIGRQRLPCRLQTPSAHPRGCGVSRGHRRTRRNAHGSSISYVLFLNTRRHLRPSRRARAWTQARDAHATLTADDFPSHGPDFHPDLGSWLPERRRPRRVSQTNEKRSGRGFLWRVSLYALCGGYTPDTLRSISHHRQQTHHCGAPSLCVGTDSCLFHATQQTPCSRHGPCTEA